MFFQHVYDKSLAQGSYIIGCQVTKEAIVIDPKRDIDTYLEIAKLNNLNITHITETHIHADYLSGTRELAAVTGATMYLSDEGGEGWLYEFPHHGLNDGDVIKVGNLSLKVMHTPGHTPESISFILTDHPATNEPVMIFTGDFVFVGDVGRPDLLEKAAGIVGTKEIGAKQMFESLKRFQTLPDYIQVWPAHGAGSACGKALGAVHSSTVGYEKIRNWALQFGDDESGFVNELLDAQPEPPKYFAMMKYLNKTKRPLLIEVPKHIHLSKEEFISAYEKGMKVIDSRIKFNFAKSFIPKSINIQGTNSFSTWAGWILNYEEQFIIVAEKDQMDDLTRKLMRIGLDNIYGFITPDDMFEWGLATDNIDVIDNGEVKKYVGRVDVQIIDTRGISEYNSGHIEGADHLFVGTILDHLDQVSKDKEIVIHCQSGDRSAVAASLLKRAGFSKIKNYLGGMKEWCEMGNNVLVEEGVKC